MKFQVTGEVRKRGFVRDYPEMPEMFDCTVTPVVGALSLETPVVVHSSTNWWR